LRGAAFVARMIASAATVLMKRILIFGWGGLLVAMGTVLIAWIAYNLFVEMQPEARGQSFIKPGGLAVAMIVVGLTRIFSQRRKSDAGANDESAR
jgi:nitrate reductase gamma subunit